MKSIEEKQKLENTVKVKKKKWRPKTKYIAKHLPMPRFCYVMVDRDTGKVFKPGNREIPYYSSIESITKALEGLNRYGTDTSIYKIAQYELVFKEIIAE